MRKLSVVTACLVGIVLLTASPVLAAGNEAAPPADQLLLKPALAPAAPLFLSAGQCSVSPEPSGEKKNECEQNCTVHDACWEYCWSVFTGTWLDVECDLDGCCQCWDIG
jgi:hypothetical protein